MMMLLNYPTASHATLLKSIDIVSSWYAPPGELTINALFDNTPEVGARLFAFSLIPPVGNSYILSSGKNFNDAVSLLTNDRFKFLSIGPSKNSFDCTNLIGVGEIGSLAGYKIDSFEFITTNYHESRYGADEPNFTCIGLTFNIHCDKLTDPIPEPATLLLICSGLAGLTLWYRRHTRINYF
jgi:hypothetical protein